MATDVASIRSALQLFGLCPDDNFASVREGAHVRVIGYWRGRTMTSERQIQTNRNNAAKSTGPRTDVGKAAVA
jgi:hypothetical protein